MTAAILGDVIGQAERAVEPGVDPQSILIDPAHDFGKNTRHSLECTRRLPQLVQTGWPVLQSAVNRRGMA